MAFKTSRVKTTTPDEAQSEVDAYQSLVGNILMMGTLIFGFCVTGTFLSVSFTGEEAWPTGDGDALVFIAFLQYGCYAAISSLSATLIAFTFSTRVANQQIHSGPLAAYRTVQLTTVFIVIAEMLLYLSLDSFMLTVHQYTKLEYEGPQLCPAEANAFSKAEVAGGPFADRFYTSSFCAQTGDEMYQTAAAWCGPAQDPQLGRSAQDVAHPFATCTAFDFYTHHYNKTLNIHGVSTSPWWFGWDWSDSGYRKQPNPKQAFYEVISEIAGKTCGTGDAQIGLNGLCTNYTLSTSACAQARSAYLQADTCSGGKQDDAMKCRKVCQWINGDGYKLPMKDAIKRTLGSWFHLMQYVIWLTMSFRLFAGLFQVVSNLRELWQDGDRRRTMMQFFDFWGICDTARRPEEEEESEDEPVDKRQLILTAGDEW